ncbi:hypothetical protein D9619_001176 [Psilocybe cf. subviscida]|uniref:F-box domain-containing protein n=1 Tax=Psilocybe cf. subviscida TaxID=2480587 RepID=A0A8H5F416_9AGAR|nr:hypothetical protein D9619_001176 [Psilocybe cf. subviscida]
MNRVETGLPDISSISLLDYNDRRTFNAESLVGRLNYDVLGNIFMQNTIIDLFSPHYPSQALRRASHVCHAWRECALGHHALWGAALDVGDPIRWIEECITRSGTSSLYDIVLPSLTAHLMSPAHGDWLRTSSQRPRQTISEIIFSLSSTSIEVRNLQLGMQVMHRARNAYIKIRKRNWHHVNDALTVAAPNLRFFSLCLQGSQQTGDIYDLQENLFDGHAPHLRGLELRGCSCKFTSPVLRNLTTLVVKRPSSQNVPSLTSWLGILTKMKDLQVVELSYCTAPVTADEDLSNWPTVPLPNLRSFTLTGYLQVCSFFVTHLSMPDTCAVTVKCYRTVRDDNFTAMMTAVHDRVQRVPPAKGRTGIFLQATPSGLGFIKQYLDEPRRHEVLYSYYWYSSSRQLTEVIAIIPDIVPTLTIAALGVPDLRLDFHNSHGVTGAHARSLLSVFESVQHLHMVMPYTVWRVLAAMRVEGAEEDAEGAVAADVEAGAAALLPELKSLLLEHVIFEDDSPKMPKADDLIQFIFGRPNIEKVALVNCEPVEYIVEELELFGITCTTTGPVTKPISIDSQPSTVITGLLS